MKIRTVFVIVVMEIVKNVMMCRINTATKTVMNEIDVRIVIMKPSHQKQNHQMKKVSSPG